LDWFKIRSVRKFELNRKQYCSLGRAHFSAQLLASLRRVHAPVALFPSASWPTGRLLVTATHRARQCCAQWRRPSHRMAPSAAGHRSMASSPSPPLPLYPQHQPGLELAFLPLFSRTKPSVGDRHLPRSPSPAKPQKWCAATPSCCWCPPSPP
jgi:hypothetical protein